MPKQKGTPLKVSEEFKKHVKECLENYTAPTPPLPKCSRCDCELLLEIPEGLEIPEEYVINHSGKRYRCNRCAWWLDEAKLNIQCTKKRAAPRDMPRM